MYNKQLFYYSFLSLFVTIMCWMIASIISPDIMNLSSEILIFGYLITIITVYIHFILGEYIHFKIKYGKIQLIGKGCLFSSYWSIKNTNIKYKLTILFGKVYSFQINNGEISINERMFSKKDFKIIEKYIHKHNKITESKKSFF